MGGGSCRQVGALRSGNPRGHFQPRCRQPLFTIAEIADGNRPERVQKAALAQTGAVDSDKTQILADVGDVFAETSLTKDDDGMPCQALVDALVAMPERSWSEWDRGKALTPTRRRERAMQGFKSVGSALSRNSSFAPVSLNVLLTNAR